MTVLSLDHIFKQHGKGSLAVQALTDVSLALAPGDFVALVGASGSGKSTLLSIAGLCDVPTSGTVHLGGEQIDFSREQRLRELRRTKLGFVFQLQNLIPHLTVLENVALPLLLNGTPLRMSTETARDILEEVGLTGRVNHYPGALSGGEAQRVGLARAVVHRPALILADEPTGSLDADSGEVVLSLLSRIAGQGVSILMATHSEIAWKRAHRTVRLSYGRLD